MPSGEAGTARALEPLRGTGAAARRLGCDPADAFAAADAVKYSTTVGTNALIERTGPKVGLITTAGQEDTMHVARCRTEGPTVVDLAGEECD